MTKGIFGVHDRVKVVNSGDAFNTYNGFFFDNKDELLEQYDIEDVWEMMDTYEKSDYATNNMKCKVLFVGKHRHSEYNEENDVLLIKDIETNDIYLILSSGVELLTVEDMNYRYIANTLDRATDLLFEIQKYCIDHNVDDYDKTYRHYMDAVSVIADMANDALGKSLDR